jgi:hypothetical protein
MDHKGTPNRAERKKDLVSFKEMVVESWAWTRTAKITDIELGKERLLNDLHLWTWKTISLGSF